MSQLIHAEVINSRAARHVSFTVPRGITEICGPNKGGKSSTMEMLMRILHGLRGFDFRKPQLTWGELRGGGRCDLGDIEAEVVLTEANQDKGGELKAYYKGSGEKVKQDQLATLLGDYLALDPLRMAELDQKNLIPILQKLAGADYCAEAERIEREHQAAYDERRFAKAELGKFGTQPPPGDEPEEIKIDAVTTELTRAQEHNGAQLLRERSIERAKDAENAAHGKAERARRRVMELEAALDDARAEFQRAASEAATCTVAVQALPQPDPTIDVAPLQYQLAAAGARNKAREQWRAAQERWSRWQAATDRVNGLERKVQQLADEREKHCRTVQLPVEGLGWGGGRITINGRPWEDESTSSLMLICAALLLEMQPPETLRLIFIHRAESLTQESFDKLRALVDAKGGTVVAEKVGEPHEGCAAVVRIVDGFGTADGEQVF